jgi:hypothetical protein
MENSSRLKKYLFFGLGGGEFKRELETIFIVFWSHFNRGKAKAVLF